MSYGLAAFGMPDTSWAWESDGPRFNIYTQGYEKADGRGRFVFKTKPAYPPDTNGSRWPTSVPTLALEPFRLGEFQQKGLTVGPAEQTDAGRFVHRRALGESVNWFAGGSTISGFERSDLDSFTFAPRGLTFSQAHLRPEIPCRRGGPDFSSAPACHADSRGWSGATRHDYGLSGIIGFPGARGCSIVSMICSRHAWRRNGIATSTACSTTAASPGRGTWKSPATRAARISTSRPLRT